MVTAEELERAITEYKSLPVTYQNCEKLAVFLYLRDKLYGTCEQPKAERFSGSEFLDAVSDKPLNKIMPILDELMTVAHDLMPTVYNEVISRIEKIATP
jgi:hypothetical protein